MKCIDCGNETFSHYKGTLFVCAECGQFNKTPNAVENDNEKVLTVNACKGLDVQRGKDGHWLSFSSGGKRALINVENKFPASSIAGSAIMNWVTETLGT